MERLKAIKDKKISKVYYKNYKSHTIRIFLGKEINGITVTKEMIDRIRLWLSSLHGDDLFLFPTIRGGYSHHGHLDITRKIRYHLPNWISNYNKKL